MAALAILTVITSAATAQTASASTIQLQGSITGTINGEPLAATITGTADPTTGIAEAWLVYTDMPAAWPIPIPIINTTFICKNSAISAEIGPAVNLLSVAGGNYTCDGPIDLGSFGSLHRTGNVSFDGSTLSSSYVLTGAVTFNEIDSVGELTEIWTPNGPGSIASEGETSLTLPGGTLVPINFFTEYTFSPSFELPGSQTKTVEPLEITPTGPSTLHIIIKAAVKTIGGGIAEPIVLGADSPAEASGSSSARDYAAPIAAATGVAALLAVAAGGWYVRRRLS